MVFQGIELRRIVEGEASFLVPSTSTVSPPSSPVFYNPRMEVSRDIAIGCLRAYHKMVGRDLKVIEPLTATGVRGIRYAKEVEGVSEVIIGDVNPLAAELAERNVELNGLTGVVRVEKAEANQLLSTMAKPGSRYDVVDLDPFGSPAPYVEAALRALNSGGLLMLTATDAPPLCGVYPRVAERRYGGRSLRTEYCHELAVRLIMGFICREAGKLDLAIKPLLSYSLEHHFRVCVLIEVGASKSTFSFRYLGYVEHCPRCGHRFLKHGIATALEERCPLCGSRLLIGGPLWCGPIQDRMFVDQVLREVEASGFRHKRRESSLLSTIVEESQAPPLYYTVDSLSHRLRSREPPMTSIMEELRSSGFQVYRTHFHPKGLKTDAMINDLLSTIARLVKIGADDEGYQAYQHP